MCLKFGIWCNWECICGCGTSSPVPFLKIYNYVLILCYFTRQYSPNTLLEELEGQQRQLELSRCNSLADGLDESLVSITLQTRSF